MKPARSYARLLVSWIINSNNGIKKSLSLSQAQEYAEHQPIKDASQSAALSSCWGVSFALLHLGKDTDGVVNESDRWMLHQDAIDGSWYKLESTYHGQHRGMMYGKLPRAAMGMQEGRMRHAGHIYSWHSELVVYRLFPWEPTHGTRGKRKPF